MRRGVVGKRVYGSVKMSSEENSCINLYNKSEFMKELKINETVRKAANRKRTLRQVGV